MLAVKSRARTRARPQTAGFALDSSARGGRKDAGNPAQERNSTMIPTVLCAPSSPRSPDQENLSQRIPHIAAALKGAKVTCVQIKYDGRFDCGNVQDPVYLTSDGVPMDASVPKGLQSELHVFFNELLELRFPEWDNAEGARGEFQWDLALDRLAQAHIVRCGKFRPTVVTGL